MMEQPKHRDDERITLSEGQLASADDSSTRQQSIASAARDKDDPTPLHDERKSRDAEVIKDESAKVGAAPTLAETPRPHSKESDWPKSETPGASEDLATTPSSPWWQGPLQGIRALLETVIPALLIAVGINLFLAQATQVQGQSMEPNLHTAQRLVVEKVSYRFHGPRRGDIVVIDLPEAGDDLLIKRVVGLPGERISSQGGQVSINQQPLDEPYIHNPGGKDVTEQTVPPLHVFVMGDNRRFSNDSRNFGPVPIDNIIGRAWFSYWPLELWGPLD